MQIKLETSPHNYASDLECAQAIKKELGIDLEIAKLAPKHGKRAVAKICLNSLWDKFGQRSNLGNTEFVNGPVRFYNILLELNYRNGQIINGKYMEQLIDGKIDEIKVIDKQILREN